ncbi:odorant receptor 46a-like [Temnothorax nylanderi]|uniref:odorant receptor 46a-like n=1 Tax=Temnothorax nylanderi TaxID=102681 RepID=UPI003A87364A
MKILSFQFLTYTICGIWRPIEWSSNGAKLLYSIFTYGVISSEYFRVLTQFMDIVLFVDNIDDFTATALLFLSMVNVCCKATFVVKRRNAIINVVESLLKAPHKPRNEDEVAIQTKFDKFIRTFSIRYYFLATGSVAGLTLGSILNAMDGHLPYRIWLPWDYNIPLVFWIISSHQIITTLFACFIDVGTDTLIFGLFLQTCVQLEILGSRLHKLIINKTVRDLGRKLSTSNKDEVEISEIVRHHLIIYKYAKTVNVIFNQVFFIQFFKSILVLCTCVFHLTSHITELSGLATFLIYTITMFVQIYIYCWSGNEVILKSISIGNAIYCMDWPLLPVNEQKDLLLIMMRSTIPITFTSSFLITFSLESYGSILKASYSAFNVLQQ